MNFAQIHYAGVVLIKAVDHALVIFTACTDRSKGFPRIYRVSKYGVAQDQQEEGDADP